MVASSYSFFCTNPNWTQQFKLVQKFTKKKYLKIIIDIDDDCENVDGGPGYKKDDGADNEQKICPFHSPHLPDQCLGATTLHNSLCRGAGYPDYVGVWPSHYHAGEDELH